MLVKNSLFQKKFVRLIAIKDRWIFPPKPIDPEVAEANAKKKIQEEINRCEVLLSRLSEFQCQPSLGQYPQAAPREIQTYAHYRTEVCQCTLASSSRHHDSRPVMKWSVVSINSLCSRRTLVP
jgi:hypothetical protein